jgi:hypothetical protein
MKKLDLSKVAFVGSTTLLLFAWGVGVGHYHLFPFPALAFLKDSVDQVLAEREMRMGTRPTEHLFTIRYAGRGVTNLDTDRAFQGLTLLSGFFDDGLQVRLVRLDGSNVARWPARFTELFPDTSHIMPQDMVPQTDWNISVLGAAAFPDGSVAFNLEGGGMAKLDRCGRVLWTVPKMVHHSIDIAEDGGFWVPGMRIIQGQSSFAWLTPPYKEDTIIRVSATGNVVDEFSILDVLFDNQLAALLFANGPDGITIGREDITHINDVEELKSDISGAFPQFSAGDLLVSVRNLNLVLVVDPRSRHVKWYQVGPWMDQHDPDFLPTGRISVFSNNNDLSDRGTVLGGTTIIEADPVTHKTVVTYGGKDGQRFYTPYRGQHQRLPNGNTLMSDSMSGRAFEVDSNGELVWQLLNSYDDTAVATVNDVLRYPDDYFEVSDWSCPE